MGLVGIMKNKNGIVAFADEKSCMNVMGIPYAASPKTVKKVFRGGNFLFVTHGANQLPEPRVYDLENAIRETKPENYSDYYRYFEVLWKRIQETGSLYLTKYNFTVGYPDTYLVDGKRTGNYGISTCYFDKIRVNYTSTTYFDDIIISGEDRFLPKVIHVRQDWTLQEMEDYCRKLVETSIYFSESTLKDNSIIGGRAIVETYVDSTL